MMMDGTTMLLSVMSGTEGMLISTNLSAMCVMMAMMPVMGSFTAAFTAHLWACAASNVMFAVSTFMGLMENVFIAEFAASRTA